MVIITDGHLLKRRNECLLMKVDWSVGNRDSL